MSYVAPQFDGLEHISILEPSVGDGSYVSAYYAANFPGSVTTCSFYAVEKIARALKLAKEKSSRQHKKGTKFYFKKTDFLKYQKGLRRKFLFAVGNPPYIKKTLLKKGQITECIRIHKAAGLEKIPVKNIWPSFLIRCAELLEENGILALVLPAELLQVDFSVDLRRYLTRVFQRTEIFTFEDLLFECKGQDTVLLIGYKQHATPGQFYTHITDTNQLENGQFTLINNTALTSTDTKWSHHWLSSDDLTFIHSIGSNLCKVDFYCNSKPGIVTGANDFFIIDNEIEGFYELSDFAKPIIQKGLFVNGSVVFDEREFEQIVNTGKPSKILVVPDKDIKVLPLNVQHYLQLGEIAGLRSHYKCSKRKHWFVVPNIGTPPDGFFFRRVHYYPKLLKNNANVLVTDSAYKIEMKDGFAIESLIYSFYNSLTLAFAEIRGRYFGGGVLELTPSEFKNIPIPYTNIASHTFEQFRKEFETKKTIEDVLNRSDDFLLHTLLNLSLEDTERIKSIRAKLILKRFRK